jgi:DNA-directed RNA polymerase subunit beta
VDFQPGIPESFNVLVRELQSLCLDVELIEKISPEEEQASIGEVINVGTGE